MPGSTLTLPTPRGFSLKHAVCSYGYFLLAPNHWDPKARALGRPLRTADDRVMRCVIRQPGNKKRSKVGGPLQLITQRKVDRRDHATLKAQATRMLRLDEDQRAWRKLHPAAKKHGFAHMFRSPTLFEDLVKTITSCNVNWKNTITMNRRMTELVGHGGFPTPNQLADFGEARLREQCRVGYRAERIVRLARQVADGTLNLDALEDPTLTAEQAFENFKALHGFGPYAAGNACHLIGQYEHLAIDTETYRHFCLHYQIKRPKNAPGLKRLERKIEKHYARYAPYQFKAYWFELWHDYEQRYGRAWTWDRDTTGQNFTAAVLAGDD